MGGARFGTDDGKTVKQLHQAIPIIQATTKAEDKVAKTTGYQVSGGECHHVQGRTKSTANVERAKSSFIRRRRMTVELSYQFGILLTSTFLDFVMLLPPSIVEPVMRTYVYRPKSMKLCSNFYAYR